ncbi:hypothetical protein NliqN6_6562 [Naganishia liquefaciens]|uniref:Uncharacterized protein n=1 Tax=Naganishia liquefaciens TaxID=104408 RepID=A0A8H3YHM4_9TREE|nr:hypothetical protein NliqN6_6562 [Naganishia liquefaciens]
MRSIWATGRIVWVMSSIIFLWDRKQKFRSDILNGTSATLALAVVSILVAMTAISGIGVAIARSASAANGIATVTGEITLPEGFDTVKRTLYIHYGQASGLPVTPADDSASAGLFGGFALFGQLTRNQHRTHCIPSFVGDIFCERKLLVQPVKTPSTLRAAPSTSVPLQFSNHTRKTRRSVMGPRALIPLEETEVVDISDKDAHYIPAKIAINRLPQAPSVTSVSRKGIDKSEGNS